MKSRNLLCSNNLLTLRPDGAAALVSLAEARKPGESYQRGFQSYRVRGQCT